MMSGLCARIHVNTFSTPSSAMFDLQISQEPSAANSRVISVILRTEAFSEKANIISFSVRTFTDYSLQNLQ